MTDAERKYLLELAALMQEHNRVLAEITQAELMVPRCIVVTSTSTNPAQRWIDSVNVVTGRVRVADVLAGTPGPWEPLAAYDYPLGPYPGCPAVPANSVATATTPAGPWTWLTPGFTGYVFPDPPMGPSAPDPVPPTEREPQSEWCCGGTCLRVNCEYHRDA